MPTLVIVPATASLAPGESKQFTLEPPATEAVQWSVRNLGNLDAGNIDQNGTYTAPSTVGAPFDVFIEAHAGEANGSATVKITAPAPSEGAGASADAAPDPATTEAASTPSGQSATRTRKVTVEPASVVLSAKAQQSFRLIDDTGQPLAAAWSLLGTGGLPPDIVGTIDATSGTYSAPAEVVAERSFAVIAAAESGATDKAFVTLTPGAVRVVPAEITLRAGEQQQFSALVQGDAANEVDWQPSPSIGTLSASTASARTLYTAPPTVPEDTRIAVTAISTRTQNVGYANVLLLADKWTGRGPQIIGVWLLALAVVAVILYYRWPPPGDRTKLAAAVAASQDANALAEQRQATAERLRARLKELQSTGAEAANLQELQSQVSASRDALTAAEALVDEANRDKAAKERVLSAEEKASNDTKDDERLLFLLVVLAGGLGSFVHTTRSFVDFVGNRRLRPSWTWWYILQPFTGSALAMVMYFVIRGGFFASAGATALNPWGFVAVAALVGLFSKQATNKLDELFSTMFRTDKERELKDKLNSGVQQRLDG